MELSEKLIIERKQDPVLLARMELAAQGQSPQFLLISPITRSGQDLQLFSMNQGDALHASRVPNNALLPPDLAPTLFKGPASYNSKFPIKRGVIVTFDIDESLEIIRETIENITHHPDLRSLPILAFQVNYENGRVKIIVHGRGRNYEYENKFMHRIRIPDELDDSLLVLICSDSRVSPPNSSKGVPMSIPTLGGYIPEYRHNGDETSQLNHFFEKWLSSGEETKRILIVAHGNFEGEGSSCSAGIASLNPQTISNPSLRPVIEELVRAASVFEISPPQSPEDRVKSLTKATKANLLTYPAIKEHHDIYRLEIEELLMDTVTNTLFQFDGI